VLLNAEYLVAVDYLETAALYDPTMDRWQPIDDVPFATGECDPQRRLAPRRGVRVLL
jgi:hypothetical protein